MSLLPVSSGDPHVPAHNEERQAINDLNLGLKTKISIPGGAATGDLLRWDGTQWLTTDTRFFEGNGRPDGVVAAPVGSRYVDKTGANGAVEWVKRSGGDSNAGWICLAGDTGVRNIASLVDKGNGTVHQAYVSRVGHVVDMSLDITMPSDRPGNYWTLIASLTGFGPGFLRHAALQANSGEANSGGTSIGGAAAISIFGIIPGKRDRFSGIWTTRDPWPTNLPGIAT